MLIKKGWKTKPLYNSTYFGWVSAINSYIDSFKSPHKGGLRKKRNRDKSGYYIPEVPMSMPIGKIFYIEPKV